MKIQYYAETDSLYIDLSSAPSAETRAISDTVNIDFAAEGAMVGIDIDQVSKDIDLATLEMSGLPLQVRRGT